jgi:hypothetical protein
MRIGIIGHGSNFLSHGRSGSMNRWQRFDTPQNWQSREWLQLPADTL